MSAKPDDDAPAERPAPVVPYLPKVKICGLTTLADAEAAVGLGAWALGMIFYAGSPRQCSLEEAALITASMRRRVELCGVFVNAPLEEVTAISEEIGLTMLQFHGEEGPLLLWRGARRTGARIVKAAQVAGPGDVRDLERFHVDFHLLDARSPERPTQRGGTGVELRLGSRGRAAVQGAADRQRRHRRSERGCGDRRHWAVCDRQRQRHRVLTGPQGPRPPGRAVRSRARRRRARRAAPIVQGAHPMAGAGR